MVLHVGLGYIKKLAQIVSLTDLERCAVTQMAGLRGNARGAGEAPLYDASVFLLLLLLLLQRRRSSSIASINNFDCSDARTAVMPRPLTAVHCDVQIRSAVVRKYTFTCTAYRITVTAAGRRSGVAHAFPRSILPS